ncbi:alpha/beta fold hydrolase [Microbacterium sp. NPDC055683]
MERAADGIDETAERAKAAIDETVAEAEAVARDVADTVDASIDELVDAPDDGRVSRFTWQGATLIAEERGAGEPVFLLVHGIGMGRKVFGDVAVRLATHGRTIAIDQPGYGEAPEPERTPAIERVADLVAAFIRDRGLERPVLVGHSMGTQVVAEVAARHPELAGPVVLVAPTVDPSARRALPQLARLGRDLLGESVKVLLLGAREYLRAGPHLRRKMRAMLAHRPEDAYPRIRSRALVVRGADDVVCPEPWCRRVAGLLPDGELVEIPGHGHETMIRDGAPAAERIREWLDRG